MSFACRLFLETDVSRENDVTHYFDTIGVLSCGRIFWKVAGEINQFTSKHLTGVFNSHISTEVVSQIVISNVCSVAFEGE